MKDLIILGAGGSGWDIVSIVNAINKQSVEWNVLGFLDDNVTLHGKEFCGVKVIGSIDECNKWPNAFFVSSIANPTNRLVRKMIWDKVKTKGLNFATIIHPSVVIYDEVIIEEGCVVNANSVLATGVTLEKDVHIGYACNIGHETRVCEHTTFGAAVNLSSGVIINPNCYIGAGVSSTHDVEVEEDTLVAVGSAIVTNMKKNESKMWIGVPAITQTKYQDMLVERKMIKNIINNL